MSWGKPKYIYHGKPNIQRKISNEDWGAYKLKRNDKIPNKPHYPDPREIRDEWDFEPIEHEAVICSHFACNKILSLRESLFGNLCISHQPTVARPKF